MLPGALWVREVSPGIQSWDYRDPSLLFLARWCVVWESTSALPGRVGALTLFSHPSLSLPESLHGGDRANRDHKFYRKDSQHLEQGQ